MKYVIAESPIEQRLSMIFPDHETHAVVFEFLKVMHGGGTKPVSAGFVNLYPVITCHGHSESLGLPSRGEIDAACLVVGEQAAFMPDVMVLSLWRKLQAREGA